jgi:predicted Zn-dependent protease with MMP-like domain
LYVSDDDLEHVLRSFEDSLAGEDPSDARRWLARLSELAGEDHIDVLYAHARLSWIEDGPAAARSELERVIAADPEHSDAHYDLGCIAEEEGDRETMIRQFLRARALDAVHDQAHGIGVEAQLAHIEQVAREVLEALPPLFAERLAHVPVILEDRPSRALVADGFDPRAFGLFDGPTDGVRDEPAPTRIVLYAANLLAEFPDEPELSEQIEVTVLHEVGHFFGLDEDGLERLGLD